MSDFSTPKMTSPALAKRLGITDRHVRRLAPEIPGAERHGDSRRAHWRFDDKLPAFKSWFREMKASLSKPSPARKSRSKRSSAVRAGETSYFSNGKVRPVIEGDERLPRMLSFEGGTNRITAMAHRIKQGRALPPPLEIVAPQVKIIFESFAKVYGAENVRKWIALS